jgi:hypothetical protein
VDAVDRLGVDGALRLASSGLEETALAAEERAQCMALTLAGDTR